MTAVRGFGLRTAVFCSEKFQKFFLKRTDEHKNSYI